MWCPAQARQGHRGRKAGLAAGETIIAPIRIEEGATVAGQRPLRGWGSLDFRPWRRGDEG